MDLSLIAVAHAASSASTTAAAAATSTAATATDFGAIVASTVATAVPEAVASILPSAVTTTVPASVATVTVPAWLELTAAFTGALSGGLAGVRMKFDMVGVITIALAAGLSGGIIRDLMLQDYGIYALEHPTLLIAVIIGAILAFYFESGIESFRNRLFLIDALSLGLFAVAGADKAILAGLTFVPAVMIGTITSVGGGIVRDMMRNEVPRVMKPGTLNGAAAVFGTITYVTLVTWLNVVKPFAMFACVLLVIALRVLAVWRGWQTPTPKDLTPVVTGLIGTAERDEWDTLDPESGQPAARASDPLDDAPRRTSVR